MTSQARATRWNAMRRGACAIGTCLYPWADCNQNTADGCETNTLTDTSNCGMCGVVCNSVGGAAQCQSGQCKAPVCSTPFADCNQDARDGCEINLNSSAGNCSRYTRAALAWNSAAFSSAEAARTMCFSAFHSGT